MDTEAVQIWSDPDQPALTLILLALDRYGTEFLSWAPTTWEQEIHDDCGVRLNPRNHDKLAATTMLLTRPDEFYGSAAGFNDIASGMVSEWFHRDTAHPLTTNECATALVQAYLIDPPEKNAKLSPEVNRYVLMIAREDGFAKPPAVLRMFGVYPDPGVSWGLDLGDSIDTASDSATGAIDHDSDLITTVSDFLLDTAERLMTLPVKNRRAVEQVAKELIAYSQPLPAQEE